MNFFSLVKPKEGRSGTENGHANNRLYIKMRYGPRRVIWTQTGRYDLSDIHHINTCPPNFFSTLTKHEPDKSFQGISHFNYQTFAPNFVKIWSTTSTANTTFWWCCRPRSTTSTSWIGSWALQKGLDEDYGCFLLDMGYCYSNTATPSKSTHNTQHLRSCSL